MSNTTPATVAEGLRELADRCERAAVEDQRDCLEAAFTAYYPGLALPEGRSAYWPPTLTKFNSLLKVEAYFDAAMTLVPEGCWAEGALSSPASLEVHAPMTFDPLGRATATTPALALCAAALRARAHIQEQP